MLAKQRTSELGRLLRAGETLTLALALALALALILALTLAL